MLSTEWTSGAPGRSPYEGVRPPPMSFPPYIDRLSGDLWAPIGHRPWGPDGCVVVGRAPGDPFALLRQYPGCDTATLGRKVGLPTPWM